MIKYNGLSVKVNNKEQFDHIKDFLGEHVVYIDWVEQMSTNGTSIVIWVDKKAREIGFSTGSIGKSEYQKEKNIRVVEFDDYFSL